VYSNNFGGDDSPNTGQTWAQFVALTGSTPIDFASLDLDGGTKTNTQVMDTTNFDVNGTVYSPTPAVPEPGSLGLMLCLFAVLGVAGAVLAAQAGSLVRRWLARTAEGVKWTPGCPPAPLKYREGIACRRRLTNLAWCWTRTTTR